PGRRAPSARRGPLPLSPFRPRFRSAWLPSFRRSALVRRATRDQCSERREGRMKLERVVALSGGVGGSRFLDGLTRELPSGALTAIVNTGDDFEHLGLYVCPDLDTVMYTLAAVGDELRGWGLAGETFAAMTMLRRYGGP